MESILTFPFALSSVDVADDDVAGVDERSLSNAGPAAAAAAACAAAVAAAAAAL